MTKLLIVVDMQNDFIYGPLGTKEARSIVQNVFDKIRGFCTNSFSQIIFTMDTHDDNYLSTNEGRWLPVKHCVLGTDGHDIPNKLLMAPVGFSGSTKLLKKSFGFNNWENFLKQEFRDKGWGSIDQIEIIGVCTDICVISNALILKSIFPEVPISVDASCCAGTTPQKHRAALDVMKSCQINVYND